MKRLAKTLTVACMLALLCATPASASFGLDKFDVTFTNEDGSPATQAGSHPFAMTTTIHTNAIATPEGGEELEEGAARDIVASQVPGFVGDPNPVPICPTAKFLTLVLNPKGLNFPGGDTAVPSCPDSTAVGTVSVQLAADSTTASVDAAVYNLAPPPGAPAKIGFRIVGVPVPIELAVSENHPYEIIGGPRAISQLLEFVGAKLTLWGVPADPGHDTLRGHCVRFGGGSLGSCPTELTERPFLTLPRACNGPLMTSFATDNWLKPGSTLANGMPDPTDPNWVTGSVLTHDGGDPPAPAGFSGCGKLGFTPSITAQPTTKAASSPTGLDFALDVNNEGLTNPKGIADADIEKAVVTLPEGFSTNPSLAEGLEVCTEADLARETPKSAPGEGCPNAAKIGTVEVQSPLLDESVNGSLYIAEPYENPFNTLLALYIVIKNEKLGIIVRQPLKVEPDPVTGQLTTIAEDMPQLPFSHFKLHFREGVRSPLASPPGCGTYQAKAVLYPYSGADPLVTNSAFEIISSPNTGPCPSGGLPPFKPGLVAGTLNNAAGRFSPFNVRLFRTDSEQEFTHFSIKLPPGIAGILAGIPYCADAAIEAARQKTGAEELANPSCPKASEIGHTLAGSGVGPALTYVPGKIYLAGPYKGTSFSLVAITAAVAGPFDLGTVIIRQGFKVDRETAEVFIDATESDPIPHIIKGIPVHLRDIRAYVDRSRFTFNPTNCTRTSTASTLLGSGLDFGSAHDDRPVTVSTPFQAADCAALKFEPKLKLSLLGGTKRGDLPAFKAVLNLKGGPEGGEANTARAQVTLPRSSFLEQGHIKTICTRVQFRVDQCPQGSVYGYARAYSPVLDTPVQGPVYLRSSEHELPDLVASLHSEKITVDVVGRIDSLKGRIRNTFEAVPDAPVTKFILTMQGGKKGLIVNSTNLCKGNHRAIVEFKAQNGKVSSTRPKVKARCGKSGKAKQRRAG